MTLIPEASFGMQVSGPTNEVFKDNPGAKLWIGKVAIGSNVINPQVYDALGSFRAKVYVEEKGFLSEDDLDSMGREYDEDDERSTNFVTLENRDIDGLGYGELVGSGRLIHKQDDEHVLPIEHYFPELFDASPVSVDSVEASRAISRHNNKGLRHLITLATLRAMTYHCVENNYKTAYFIVEKPLLHLLGRVGMPLNELGDPKQVVEPGGIRTIYPVSIHPQKILDTVNPDGPQTMLAALISRDCNVNGQGYYDSL